MPSRAIATLVKIMESLPENVQDQVVEHLQEYMQQSNIPAFPQVVEFDWEEWERRVEAANPDPDELTTEEICEIVREVRSEKLLESNLHQ